jgi:parallel beta-helix repeat protein
LILQNGINGIVLSGSSNIQLNNICVSNNSESGISLISSQKCIIHSCKISGNQIGIHLSNSSTQTSINSNTIIGNIRGIFIDQGNSNNLVCSNNFNNRQNAYDAGSENLWNLNYPTGGNYWNNYNGGDRYNGINQDRPGPDGLGDIPYYISGGISKDRYPLMVPFIVNSSRPITNLNTGKQFTKIGDAIEDEETVDGHIITVKSGIYYEKITLTKSLQLIGENKETTIIDGYDSTQDPNVVKILKNNTRINGFTIQYSNPDGFTQYVLLAIQSQRCRIDNNIIMGSRNSGINIWGVSMSHSSNNTFLENIVINNERGVVVTGSDNVFIDNNILHNNWGMAMYAGSVRNLIYHNNINNSHNAAAFNQYTNFWDNGAEGNYWQDFPTNQGYNSGVYIITNPNNVDHNPYEYLNGWE